MHLKNKKIWNNGIYIGSNNYPIFFRLKVKYILGLWKEDYENRRNLEKIVSLGPIDKIKWNRGIHTLHYHMNGVISYKRWNY